MLPSIQRKWQNVLESRFLDRRIPLAAVQEIRLVPFGRATVLRLMLLTALPFAPLMLTMIPLEQLIDRVLGVFF